MGNHWNSNYGMGENTPNNEAIGNWFVGLAIVVMIFMIPYTAKVDVDPNGEKQRALYGYQNYEQLVAEANRLEANLPRQDADLSEGYTWLGQIRVAQSAVEDFYSWNELTGAQSLELGNRLKAIEGIGVARANFSRFTIPTTDAAQKKYYAPILDAYVIPSEWLPILPRVVIVYFAAAFLMLILMGMKARNRNYPLMSELLTITRLPMAMLFWPICAFAYPYGSPLQSLSYALKMATYVLASVLFVGVAGGKAQTNSSSTKKSGSKASAEWVVQADARYGEVVVGNGPDPSRQLRITVTSPMGWLVENVTASNARQWNNFFSAGKRIIKRPYVTVNVLGAFRATHNKITDTNDVSVAMNTQVFGTVKLPKRFPGFDAVTIANPVVQFEKPVTGNPANKRLNFTWVNQTFVRSKRFGLFPGWEFVLSKTSGRPHGFNTGPLLEWKIPKKNWPRIGVGYLTNQAGVGVLRFRLTQTLAF